MNLSAPADSVDERAEPTGGTNHDGTPHEPGRDYLVLDEHPHLVANECAACGARYFDRRNACAKCFGREFTKVDIVPEGTVVIERGVSAQEFGPKLNRTAADVLRFLLNNGEMITATMTLSDDQMEVFALEIGADILLVEPGQQEEIQLQSLFDDSDDDEFKVFFFHKKASAESLSAEAFL